MTDTLKLPEDRIRRPRSDNQRCREYERRKEQFLRDNPRLTPKEYEAGIRQIIDELGV